MYFVTYWYNIVSRSSIAREALWNINRVFSSKLGRVYDEKKGRGTNVTCSKETRGFVYKITKRNDQMKSLSDNTGFGIEARLQIFIFHTQSEQRYGY